MSDLPTFQDLIDRCSLDILSDTSTQDRLAKKQALCAIRKECNALRMESWGRDTTALLLQFLFDRFAIWAASDIEYIREQTVQFLLQLVLRSTLNNQQMADLVALTTKRLGRRARGMATVQFAEPTEEIRAQWLDVLQPLLTCDDAPRPDAAQVEKWLDVIQLAIGDASPEVQKKGARMLKSLATKASKEIALTGDRPMQHCVLPLLYHKHAPVRVLGLEAAEQVGQSIPSSVPVLFRFDKIANRQASFPLLVYDTSLAVRSMLVQVAASFLKDCGPRSRYDNAPHVVPVLLGCTADEVQSVEDNARKAIDEVAEAFAGDMLAAGLWDDDSNINEESHARMRRIAGLQHAVHQCYRECLKELLNEVHELSEDRRVRALGVLESLINYATEEDVIASSQQILDTLFNAVNNGFGETSVILKAQKVLRCFGNRDVRALYMTNMLHRLDQNTDSHAEIICNDNGLVAVILMLISLLEGCESAKQYPSYELGQLLDMLCRPYFWELLLKQEVLAVHTARLLEEIVRLQTDPSRNADQLVCMGLVLLAGSQIRQRAADGPLSGIALVRVKAEDIIQRHYTSANRAMLRSLLAAAKASPSAKVQMIPGKAMQLLQQLQSSDASGLSVQTVEDGPARFNNS